MKANKYLIGLVFGVVVGLWHVFRWLSEGQAQNQLFYPYPDIIARK